MAMQNALVNCGKCGKPMPFKLGQGQIINMPGVSMLVIEHSSQELCPSCGAVIQPTLTGVQGFQIAAVPVPPSQQNDIIIPPGFDESVGKERRKTMDMFIGSLVLLGLWCMVAVTGHGYANTMDRVALVLHRHAIATRKRHGERAKVVRGMWSGRRVQAVEVVQVPAIPRRSLKDMYHNALIGRGPRS